MFFNLLNFTMWQVPRKIIFDLSLIDNEESYILLVNFGSWNPRVTSEVYLDLDNPEELSWKQKLVWEHAAFTNLITA